MINICPYCGSHVDLVDSAKIYGKSYGLIYLCSNYPKCDAYVGTHKGTDKPLGTMANSELRKFRKEAHFYFDQTWRSGKIKRKRAYAILAERLGIAEAHIAEMNIDQCKKVIKIFSNNKAVGGGS